MTNETVNLELTIQELEKKLLQPDIRRSTEALNQLLSDDFLEYGASGNVYTKTDILENLPKEKNYCEISLSNFKLKILCKNVVHVVYKTQRKGNKNRVLRSSIWKKHSSYGWQMYFHQGTAIEIVAE
ncbi:MAG: nuclear transport factor 2 family protein [Proteobacteria bacterium]|nr:nuclear transport factor 2 family protein [Pseudomonadota bacterium]